MPTWKISVGWALREGREKEARYPKLVKANMTKGWMDTLDRMVGCGWMDGWMDGCCALELTTRHSTAIKWMRMTQKTKERERDATWEQGCLDATKVRLTMLLNHLGTRSGSPVFQPYATFGCLVCPNEFLTCTDIHHLTAVVISHGT